MFFRAAPPFGDNPDLDAGGVHVLELSAGDVFYMPGGTIHSVRTPERSIVFGSNFIYMSRLQTVARCYTFEVAEDADVMRRFPDLEPLAMLLRHTYPDNPAVQDLARTVKEKARYNPADVAILAKKVPGFDKEFFKKGKGSKGR